MAENRISLEEVRRIAALARLSLPEAEAEQARAHLDAILDYMAELDAVDVSGVEPTFHSIPMAAPLRADVPAPCARREEVLAAAPESEAGGFAVPRVLEVDG